MYIKWVLTQRVRFRQVWLCQTNAPNLLKQTGFLFGGGRGIRSVVARFSRDAIAPLGLLSRRGGQQ